jgi:hypothetical protein
VAYSTVFDKPLKMKRRTEMPTVDGESVVQELGSIERKIYRFFWITTAELQAEIEAKEAEAVDGWVIVGDVTRSPISEPLDLYNAQINMQRYVSS